MHLITFKHPSGHHLGILDGETVIDVNQVHQARLASLGRSLPNLPQDVGGLLAMGTAGWDHIKRVRDYAREQRHQPERLPAGTWLAAGDLQFLPPVLRPGKIICVGLNYPPPQGDAAGPAPRYPVLFHKVATCLVGQLGAVRIPAFARQVTYEGELAVVIGGRGRYIAPEDAGRYIAGYTIANDIGASDIQARSSQWTSGKMLDTFCPLGPALATPASVPHPQELRIQTRLNQQVVQDATTAEMIFDIPTLVSYISQLATLEPGDLILTGSPKRVGQQPDPRLLLKPGDTIAVSIEKLGTLTNPVAAEEVQA